MIRASSCREKALFLEGIYLLVLIEIEQRSDLLLPGVYYLLIILINRAIGVLRDRMAEQGVVEARLEIIEGDSFDGRGWLRSERTAYVGRRLD